MAGSPHTEAGETALRMVKPEDGVNVGLAEGYGRVGLNPGVPRKAPLQNGRCLLLEAVPGKTGRTEFQGGRWKRGLWWNSAPTRNRKSGVGQAST